MCCCSPSRRAMARSALVLCTASLLASVVLAQPSPDVQKRISAAIASAVNETTIDYTEFVNPFIGTGMSMETLAFALASEWSDANAFPR